ncbi:hypothetical protein WJX81_005331 [Elliptochloris bilobata]|uniref:AAA+ ATPase domain-containing protein n=1 Tax=Elliptochloris bilobata TaxID=381761 RepID=A0AAW1RIZ2_9CHLO
MRAFILDSDEDETQPRPRVSSAKRHRRQPVINRSPPDSQAFKAPLVEHSAQFTLQQDVPATPVAAPQQEPAISGGAAREHEQAVTSKLVKLNGRNAPGSGCHTDVPAGDAKPPPNDFFLSASQKRARREAAAAAAQEATRAVAEELQRLQAEARAALVNGRKPHPFLAPRPSVAAGACASRESTLPAGPGLPLPPALPAIHVLQVSAEIGAPVGWLNRRPEPAQAPATLASPWQDAGRLVDARLTAVFVRDEAPGMQQGAVEGAQIAAPEAKLMVAPARPAEGVPANALWTDKYRPASAAEVCGNQRAAVELRAWLQTWRPRRAPATGRGAPVGSDGDAEWCQGSQDMLDSEEDERDTGGGAAWISGPVGSGKTAAVAAVAQELGLQVLEVNPGSERTGALVTKAVGEATQSCRLAQANAESGGRTVVVFEEIDNLADADRGFLAALATLIADSKRPIVLMSNAAALPAALARARLRHLPFKRPSLSAAVRVLAGVCADEGALPEPAALQTLALQCRCDLRRCLLEAQALRQRLWAMFCSARQAQRRHARKRRPRARAHSPAPAAQCEAVWACAGGGGAAGRMARAERLHAAARMAWLERLREDADSMTAGGRMRRRRGFRSYVASALLLPEDVMATLTHVGSSLATPQAPAVDVT